MRNEILRAWFEPVVALAIALVVSAAIVLAAGEDPVKAFAALARGAFGGLDALSEVLVKTSPLLLAGIAVAVAFRTGIWNIGAEGQLLAGALAVASTAAVAPGLSRSLAIPVALVLAAAAGALWASVAAWLKTARQVNEVISTIMLNFVALWLLSWLVHGALMEQAGAYPQSDSLPTAYRLPRFAAGYRAHGGILLAFAAAFGAYALLFRTVLGYELRVTGQNPTAARLAGISPARCTLVAMAISGAVAGLAGAVEVSAVTFRLYERFSPGYGYTAIAVALLGRLHPFGVCAAAVIFGALEAGSSSMQRVAGIPAVLVSVIQSIVIFTLLAFEYRARLSLPGPRPRKES